MMAVVSLTSMRQDVFNAIRSFLIINKPAYTRTVEGVPTVFTYDVVSEYPKDNPNFPLIVLDKADIGVTLLNLDGSGEDYAISIQLDFYAKEAHGKKAIDEAIDSLMTVTLNNLSSFNIDNGLVPDEDFWDDSNNAVFQDKNQILNTASVIIKFKRK